MATPDEVTHGEDEGPPEDGADVADDLAARLRGALRPVPIERGEVIDFPLTAVPQDFPYRPGQALPSRGGRHSRAAAAAAEVAHPGPATPPLPVAWEAEEAPFPAWLREPPEPEPEPTTQPARRPVRRAAAEPASGDLDEPTMPAARLAPRRPAEPVAHPHPVPVVRSVAVAQAVTVPDSPAAEQSPTPSPSHEIEIRKDHTMGNVDVILKDAMQIDGAIGVALVDYESGMTLGQSGGSMFNLEVAAAGNTDVVRAKMRTLEALGLSDSIQDILITLDTQYHLIRLMTGRSANGLFLYLALHKNQSNLAMARHQLANLERRLEL
jgi:hypothetical protein